MAWKLTSWFGKTHHCGALFVCKANIYPLFFVVIAAAWFFFFFFLKKGGFWAGE
jgi:hypothetical protein